MTAEMKSALTRELEDATAAKYKLQGAQLAWRIFRYLVAGGAGAAIVKFASVSAGAQ